MAKFALLHGAKENSGDFLIRDAAKSLLINVGGIDEEELLMVDVVRENVPNSVMDEISDTKAAFLAGGPGYQPDFYPGVYPSMKDLLDATTVVPLGPGWKGIDEDKYTFTVESTKLLQRIAEQDQVPYLGARDIPTVRVLRKHGVAAELTGCPAWYYPDGFPPSRVFDPPSQINEIIVSSPPQNSTKYMIQYYILIQNLLEKYPGSVITCAFHRGEHKNAHIPIIGYPWEKATWAANTSAILYKYISKIGKENDRIKIFDASQSADYINRYSKADLHVGYRVHGHIPALAAGIPSFLLQIDGRGFGVSESLETPGDVSARQGIYRPISDVMESISNSISNAYSDFESVDENRMHAYENMTSLISPIL
ncbi:polysaccharide pyruvyl transferase family protein [Halapricum hydrolyticum]|uniref:Polysaccharide pyruvyl transferase family protein n=1 Tax=Halapricum hydrolyticum TaxID=2979991 RepID=A0AAE3IDC3_9EURY|nr:polysaccharide pyruvyl transferase family protein [Halapricum hydrolyticum]MCU4719618.1 polysaccharide pyruvyl transferase family protein [Halapricum hydrolyticum]MCU4728533.1 polysaccharide pyruvyl transferase family protein [Halapricum hydrolyticum]